MKSYQSWATATPDRRPHRQRLTADHELARCDLGCAQLGRIALARDHDAGSGRSSGELVRIVRELVQLAMIDCLARLPLGRGLRTNTGTRMFDRTRELVPFAVLAKATALKLRKIPGL